MMTEEQSEALQYEVEDLIFVILELRESCLRVAGDPRVPEMFADVLTRAVEKADRQVKRT